MKLIRRFAFVVILFSGLVDACAYNLPTVPPFQMDDSGGQVVFPDSEVEFEARLLFQPQMDIPVYLQIMDAFAPEIDTQVDLYQLQPRGQNVYGLKLTQPFGSIVRYRYFYSDPANPELDCLGKPVEQRFYRFAGNGKVQDIICAFEPAPYNGETGRISGQIFSQKDGAPLVDILVSSGGQYTFTASDGSFLIDHLPTGTHNLFAMSVTGEHEPFQQGAEVAANSTTLALIHMKPAKIVEIKFNVQVEEAQSENLPIRMAGNLYQFGYTFSWPPGGSNLPSLRAPLLVKDISANQYSITLSLPSGYDFRYKYTLGNGFINGELDKTGKALTRQLLVPEANDTIEDGIAAFSMANIAPLPFMVRVPNSTPPSDIISIQFNLNGWRDPIPMCSLGDNQWLFTLYNPLQNIHDASYRYCRNEQCGFADDIATMGKDSPGLPVAQRLLAPNTWDTVAEWAYSSRALEQATVVGHPVRPRSSGFITGVELISPYSPTWLPYMESAFQNIHALGANRVFLPSAWGLIDDSKPVLDVLPGQTPLWAEMTQMLEMANRQGLRVVIYPMIHFDEPIEAWWQNTKRDAIWWQNWFDRYRVFMLHHADLAESKGAAGLVLDGGYILPFVLDVQFSDGSYSNPPEDAEGQMLSLIQEIRSRYHGTLFWALSNPSDLKVFDDLAGEADWIYLNFSPPLNSISDQPDINAEVSKQLDNIIYPAYVETNKPLVIGIRYPSEAGARNGCTSRFGDCWRTEESNLASLAPEDYVIDEKLQDQIYAAYLYAINQRDWVKGFVSQGYYPPAALADPGTSIHGKLVSATLWYWYPRMVAEK
ncbi:MAG: hypothetical protein HPY45_04055 [Anaerolineae bacterium]|nr:hypothetical protein [Anaerolineae bacterium]